MHKSTAHPVGRPRAVHRHAWLWEPLEAEPSFVLRAMFGTKAVYLDGKLMFCFCAREEPWRGLLVGTEHTHHPALITDFPALAPHPILPKWLYLPETADSFERTGIRLVALARQRDPRLGVTPKAKRKTLRAQTRQGPGPRPVPAPSMSATHFNSAADFRRWLEKNHASVREFHVGFYNKKSGKGGLTYQESVDEALCFGWIDGIVRRIDANSYSHRFTPRKPGSIWSNINVGHVDRLTKAGKMHPAGLAAFAARTAEKTGIYSFEQKQPASLPPAVEKKFKANKKAWAFFKAQAPWYQRLITHKIVNAKQPATRERWLTRAIEASAAGQRLD